MMGSYERQLCTQKELAMAVRMVMITLMIFLMVSFFTFDNVKWFDNVGSKGGAVQTPVQREFSLQFIGDSL